MTGTLYGPFFFCRAYGAHPALHSFPTRRSSDLEADVGDDHLAGVEAPRRDVKPHLRCVHRHRDVARTEGGADRKSTRLNSSHSSISYAVFCLKKKTQNQICLVPCLVRSTIANHE